MKIVAHDGDCVAICSDPPRRCRCAAQADLAELVAAAEDWVALDEENELLERIATVERRLDAALKPFREEKPDARFPCEPRPE